MIGQLPKKKNQLWQTPKLEHVFIFEIDINNDELLEINMRTYEGNKKGEIIKLINLQSPFPLFLPLSRILKVKLKLIFYLIISVHSINQELFPSHEVIVIRFFLKYLNKTLFFPKPGMRDLTNHKGSPDVYIQAPHT